jgi:hypothetical protein
MSNEEIKDAINKTMATALKHPDEIIINTVKNISKQEDQIPKDARNLLNYAAKGKTDQVSKLAADKIVEYGPWFLIPEEKELETAAPELFNAETKPSVESAELKPYGGPGGGHHVPAKSAFIGAPNYDLNKALAIPNEELARWNVIHSSITAAQRIGYKAFAATGATLTWDAVATIETNALERAGMEASSARQTVNEAIGDLKKAGVANPTRIPWSK